MRKTLVIALGAAIALATAAAALGVAFTASGVSDTTAGFATDKVTHLNAKTCTGVDGKTFTVTKGHYTGTADFTNPGTELDGALTINARTTYSTTDGRGYVKASFRIRGDEARLSGKFWGTLEGTQFVGFLTASSRGQHATVLGNLSATFDPATGFSGGEFGAPSSTAVLAVVGGPVCKGSKSHSKSKLVSVHGEVSAVGDGSVGSTITVTSKGSATTTCTRDATSPTTTGFAVSTKVRMKCENIGTTWTLRRLDKHK
jgi:hypothetical protein